MNKRRFSEEQIRSLESIFYSTDSKLDSRKKVQLATELGLQPRQIAIWFQNRRARWKSKQMENDFRSLRANYDNLASQFKTLQEEKNSLLSKLQKLTKLVQEGPHESYYLKDNQGKPKILQDELEENGVTNLNNNYRTDKKWTENEESDQAVQVIPLSDDRNDDVISYTEEQVCQILNPNGSFESSEKWCGFEHQSCSNFEGLSLWG